MRVTISPYIDTTITAQPAASDTTAAQASTDVPNAADSSTSFSSELEAAKRAITALTIDFITSHDEATIREAAAILSSSNVTQLQDIGKALMSIDTSPDSDSASTKNDPFAAANSAATDAAKRTSSGKEPSSSSVSADAADVSAKLGCPDNLQCYFSEAAEKYNVDVALLESIAKAESNFRTDAKSSAGAVGVMQLMPSTAKGLGVDNSYDAYQNIMGGAKLISDLLNKYDGNTSLALAAYNAGSGNVKKYGGIPPFKETQNYVAKVLKYYEDAA